MSLKISYKNIRMEKYKKLIFNQSFVNGEWVNVSKTKIQIKNPADLSVIAEVYDEDRSMVKQAIDAAHDAFKLWKKKSAKERSAILLKWYDLIIEHKEEIATIMTLECGKPYAES
jgi:succinate-semialdehyde dehydrogenase / glutarate-semialdehyde dehydrogenase